MSSNLYDDLLETVRIETTRKDGKHKYGNGFFYDFCFKERSETQKWSILALVTNRHVVEDSDYGYFYVNKRGRNKECVFGEKYRVEFANSDLTHHPDKKIDLSIIPLKPLVQKNSLDLSNLFINHTYVHLLPEDKQWNSFGPAEDLITIGYPNGFWDDYNNMPIFRRGLTATHPKLNFRGPEQFLIDTPIYPGMSGSPVFMIDYGYEKKGEKSWSTGNRWYFIGIMYAMAIYSEKTDGIEPELIPTDDSLLGISSSTPNLGYAIKSTKLKDFDKPLRSII
jgi:hypothetical protein